MPKLIKTRDEIMYKRKADTYFLTLDIMNTSSSDVEKVWHAHLEWFEAQNLAFETAAPRGWLGGDPGSYAVYFDGVNDPRLTAYCQRFEDKDGRSLQAEYQLGLLTYQNWLQSGGKRYLLQDRAEEDL